MTTHASILEQLSIREARTGEKMIPRDVDCILTWRDDIGDNWWWETENVPEGIPCTFHDAHAHIEQAGLLAVLDSGYFLARSVNFAFMKDMAHAVMWYPTLADALDAALKQINKESK